MSSSSSYTNLLKIQICTGFFGPSLRAATRSHFIETSRETHRLRRWTKRCIRFFYIFNICVRCATICPCIIITVMLLSSPPTIDFLFLIFVQPWRIIIPYSKTETRRLSLQVVYRFVWRRIMGRCVRWRRSGKEASGLFSL